jgi:hypothetical protein
MRAHSTKEELERVRYAKGRASHKGNVAGQHVFVRRVI